MPGRARTEAACVTAWHSAWQHDQRERFRARLAELQDPAQEHLLAGLAGLGLDTGPGKHVNNSICLLTLY